MSLPKTRALYAITTYLLDKLVSEGFRFSQSQLTFKKKVNADFVYEIRFVGSRNNYDDQIITFDVHFLIYSPSYKKWCKTNFPNLVILGEGYIFGDWSMAKESSPRYRNHFGYDFVQYPSEVIMEEIWNDYQNYQKKYFEANNSWEKIHKGTTNLYMEIDSMIFLGRKEEALALIKQELGIRKKDEATRSLTGNNARDIEFLEARVAYLNAK